MSSFYFPKNIDEYEKAVKEWSTVRKQLNDKVIATKLGDQLIEESQAKQPQTKLLQEIASSLTRQIPIIDTATNLPKPGEVKTEKLLDSVIQIPNKLDTINELLTITNTNSVPYLVVDKLNDLSSVISNLSIDQLQQNIEKSLDKTFKKLGSKLDDITIHTKTIGESIEESKIAEEKIISDIEMIKNNFLKSSKIKTDLIKNSKGLTASTTSSPKDIKKKIKDSLADLNDLLPTDKKVKYDEVKTKDSINEVFNKTVNKTITDEYKDALRGLK